MCHGVSGTDGTTAHPSVKQDTTPDLATPGDGWAFSVSPWQNPPARLAAPGGRAMGTSPAYRAYGKHYTNPYMAKVIIRRFP